MALFLYWGKLRDFLNLVERNKRPDVLALAGVGTVCTYLTYYSLRFLIFNSFCAIFGGFLCTFAFLTAVIAIDFYRKVPNDTTLPLDKLFNVYVQKTIFSVLGFFMFHRLISDTRQTKATQEETLLRMIKENSETDYGQLNGFDSVDSREEYVKKVPLTTYQDIKPYVDRIAKGELYVLTKERVAMLGTTSGTSGTSNMLPIVNSNSTLFVTQALSVSTFVMNYYFPGFRKIRRDMRFGYTAQWGRSEAGIPIGPGSTAKTRFTKMIMQLFPTPTEAYAIKTETELRYIHFVFGLKDSSIGSVNATFASLVYSAFSWLKENWRNVVQDIEYGNISPDLKIDENIREKLNSILEPDPQRAQELRTEFDKGFDRIVKRVWPHCQLIYTVDSGSLSFYGELLRESYFKDVPFYSPVYGSTEGMKSVNLWPLSSNSKREYLLSPRGAFYEFIPVDRSDEEQPQTLFVDQVEVGKLYELVITSVNGLYRYRFGDVVQVTRLHNDCPVVEFKYRQGQLLNIASEKTPEPSMYQAITETLQKWPGIHLEDYTCTLGAMIDKVSGKTHGDNSKSYAVFLEISGENNVEIIRQNEKEFDATLCRVYELYGNYRGKGFIEPMKVYLLKPGSFARYKDYLTAETKTSANQLKVPRALKRENDVRFILQNVLD